jgi:hypothetical protein
MTGTFACPECGSEVTLVGATPGREVRCAHCEAWVEVPYLPRHGVWTRPRFRKARPSWVIPLAWTGVAVLAVIVAAVSATRIVASRSRAARDASLEEILRAAETEERAGRTYRALSEVEAAITFLRPSEPAGSERLASLARRRDALSVIEAERRLAAAETAAPDAAVGDLLSLQARARADRAIDALTPVIQRAIEAARRRQVAADLASARRARDEGRPLDALSLAVRALTITDKLESDRNSAHAAEAEASALLAPILEQIGVVVVQLPGQYTIGTPDSYESTLGARAVDALRKQGFAPRPPTGPARPLWDQHASYRLEFQLVETQPSLYLQSKSRVSEIKAVLCLRRHGQAIWTEQITGRTQVPLPDIAAFQASRLAVSDHRDPDTERRFYDNARRAVLDAIDIKLRVLPTP